MSTNSTIAVQLPDGSIKQVYCHWDGYLEHNGKLLVENYNAQDFAEALVELGSISSLHERITPTSNSHTYDNPEKGVTVFFGRDCGEEDTEYQQFFNFEDYDKNGRGEQFNYLFADGRWSCECRGEIINVARALNE